MASNNNVDSTSGHKDEKIILKSNDLLQYILKTSVYPREHEQLKQIREATVAMFHDFRNIMNVPADQGLFLSMLLKLMNAKKILEIGVFTGYSLLTTALALPEDTKVVGVDTDREAYEIGLPFIKEAGVEHKIEFIQSDAMSVINEMLHNGKEAEFDFIFVDADKGNYPNYHDLLMKLVKVGGLIGYDNTLWFGTVALPEDEVKFEGLRIARNAIMELKSIVASDPRIELCHLSIGDGLTLCKRLHELLLLQDFLWASYVHDFAKVSSRYEDSNKSQM